MYSNKLASRGIIKAAREEAKEREKNWRKRQSEPERCPNEEGRRKEVNGYE